MSAIARWFLWQGKTVFGYDISGSDVTKGLELCGVSIHYDLNLGDIPVDILQNRGDTMVVYTPCIGNNDPMSNVIFAYLKQENFCLLKRSDIFREITKKYFTIAVAGTHGKTTTTALLAHVLCESEKKVVAFVGGRLLGYGSNFLYNCAPDDDFIVVVEADEYDRFFLCLDYDLGIVTTADPDHLDYYLDEVSFIESFLKFVRHVIDAGDGERGKYMFIHHSACDRIGVGAEGLLRYGISSGDIRARNIQVQDGHFCFDYSQDSTTIGNIKLLCPGYHQVCNATAVIAVCLHLGLDAQAIVRAFATYQGVYRRFNVLLKSEGMVLIDDFAHHPVEIEALLSTVKALYPGRGITMIFQPHTYTRTIDFLEGFIEVLSGVDALVLLDIFAAREHDVYNFSSKDLFDKIFLERKNLCKDPKAIVEAVSRLGKPEVVLVVGAGDISALIAQRLIGWMEDL